MKTTTFMASALLAAASAFGGIKYWDNPDFRTFDVDCYVQSDLIWNFDGIRNNGADQPHSTTATTWKNLGSSGANNDVWVRYLNQAGNNWGNSSAPSNLDDVNGRDLGSWTENGFTFTGDSEWRASGSAASIDSGTNYTLQALVSGNWSSQKYSKPYIMSVQQSNFCLYGDPANSRLYWGMSDTIANHVFFSEDTLGYMTAIANADENTVAFFSGTTIPTSGDGFRQFSVGKKNDSGYCLCGYTGQNGQFVGTIHSYRYYKRVLTEEELAWNRVVDERRFFPTHDVFIPVTNVVVATAVVGATGAEPAGCYAVDGSHLFIAPATVTVGGIDYVCTGYTLETHDGDGWSAAVFHKTPLYQPVAFLVTDTDCVRLTWQWAKADGLANLYTVDDYVWDGLEVFYDGICNVGTNQSHSYTTVNWVNLGSKGSDNNMFVQRLNAAGTAWETAANLDTVGIRNPGYWTENGFRIDAEGRFRCNSPGGFNVGTSYSLQMLVDAKASDQVNDNYAYLLGANNNKFSLRLRKAEGKLLWKYETGSNDYPFMSGDKFDYLTAIMRDTNKQTLFSGTTEPTSGSGYRQDTACIYSENGFALGGYSKDGVGNLFVGTIKSFRQYNRALSEAEVVTNRVVDNWRYFGIPDVTNVIVQSTVPYLRGEEPDGPYAVDGSHVFTAPATVTVKGITYACDGYIVETWDNGNYWTGSASYSGNSFTYTVGTSPALVRLTWKWKATHGLRTATDYSFDDYSQAGLFWNYDGIRNQGGTDEDHDSSAATWKNLGSGGSKFDLSWKSGTTSTGAWAADGYIFRGGPRFWNGSTIGPIRNFTLQALVDANTEDLPTAKEAHYVMTAMWDNFDLALRTEDDTSYAGSFYCNFNGNGDSKQTTLWFKNDSRHYDFATAIMDYDTQTAKIFQGVDVPTNGTGFCQFATMTDPHGTTAYGLGNYSTGDQGLVGTLKSFRYYDRVLTEEELSRNRNADAVRYFGVLGVTNVVVEVAEDETYDCTPASGTYFVEGSYDFTAAGATGCKVQVRNGDGWRVAGRNEGDTFRYPADLPEGATEVKIVWCKANPFVLIVR